MVTNTHKDSGLEDWNFRRRNKDVKNGGALGNASGLSNGLTGIEMR